MIGKVVNVIETVDGQIKADTSWSITREMSNGMYQIVKNGKRGKPLSWVFNPENVAYIKPSNIENLVNEGFITVQ